MKTIGKENSGQVSKLLAAICRWSRVFKLWLTLGPMLKKTNKIRKNFDFQNFKNPKCNFFARTIGKKMQEKFENFRLRFVEAVAF